MAETQSTQNQTSGEGFAALFEQAASGGGAVEMGGEGQIVTGIVVAVHRDSVVVDIGGKSEGVIKADEFIDAKHCTIEEAGGRYRLTDHGTHNGTYLRIKSEVELGHGDYVFIGKKLLRVELNA